MVEVDFVYRLIMSRWFSCGEFSEAVQDSQRDRAEGYRVCGCSPFRSTLIVVLFPKHSKLQVSFRGPAHFHEVTSNILLVKSLSSY